MKIYELFLCSVQKNNVQQNGKRNEMKLKLKKIIKMNNVLIS